MFVCFYFEFLQSDQTRPGGEKVNRGKGEKIEKKRDRERKNTENLLHHLLKKTSKNTVWKPQQQPTYALLTVNKKY